MPGPEMDLKRELIEAGNRLLRPPDSVDELLTLLDRVLHCLSFVEQQPAVGIQDALCPTFKALITDELLKHPDADVRVGVTACLTEISRITAPDIPYNDDLMKEVFRLTISSFEGLSDNSSKSFSKRVSILEIVARVRSCVVLLDLECNDLVVEMFQIFYKCIRDFHAAIVFASMESIMTLVIEESEEISTDLLLALLSVLKKENKDALPIARKLGEKVVQNCATILKSCIVEAIKSLKINLLDYDFVATMACQITQDQNPLTDNIPIVPLVNGSETAAVVEDVAQENVVANYGNPEVVEDATIEMLNTSNKPVCTVVVHTAEIQDQLQPGQDAPKFDIAIDPEPVFSTKSEPKSEKVVKKRGRKPKGAKEIVMQTDSSKMRQLDSNKESSEVNIHIESRKAPPEDSSVEPKNKSDSSHKRLSQKAMVNNAVTLASPSPSDSLPGKRTRKLKKASTHEKTPSHRSTENEAPNRLDDTETGLICSEKETPDEVVDVASKLVSLVEIKKEQDNEGESEDTPPKQSSLPLGVSGGTLKTKKRGRPRKDASISVATGVKDGVSSEGTSKKRSSHRFTTAVDGKEYGEELVGSRIKVWWPQDKEYYDGIVDSFDSVKKKHKILYSDNEREVLNLHKQKWKLVKSSVGSDENEEACHTNAGDSSDTQQNKNLKMDFGLVGKMGNTDSSPKRRGRPPKSATALANYDTAAKGSKPEGETNVDESMNDTKTDAGNSMKSTELLSNSLPNLNDLYDESVQDVRGNDVTQANEDFAAGTGVIDSMALKKAKVGIDINETFTLGSDENPNHDETATHKNEHSDVNVTKEIKSGSSGGSKTEELNKDILVYDAAKKSRRRKVRTSLNSSSPAVPVSADTSVKRRRGRPSKLLLATSDEKSEIFKKQASDSKVDESRCGGHSDNVIVENFELNGSKHSVVDKDKTNSTDSIGMGIKVDVAPKQKSSKSTYGELKSGSSTRLKLKLKTSDANPKLRKRKARKTMSSSSEQVKKDGSVKRPRGRPCKPKIGDPESDSKREGSSHPRAERQNKADDYTSAVKPDISRGNGSGSRPVFKNDTPNMSNVPKDSVPANVVMKDKQDSVPSEAMVLKLGLASECKSEDAIEKPPESEASKEKMITTGSSKEQQSEANTAFEGVEKSRKKRSKKPRGEEVFIS